VSAVWDDRVCRLGEGPLWHPERGELFWFDILAGRLMTRGETWDFGRTVSAAGWVDRDTLLVASDRALLRLDIATGEREEVVPLEADDPVTRSNDGRADPWGGFWIGTMGKAAEPGAGALYRYYRGELRRLIAPLTIPNAICFAPDGGHAYVADTPTGRIMRQPLSGRDGWPAGEPELFLDLSGEGLRPDGAVVDAAGNLWNAQWGAGRVAAYGADGRLVETVAFGATQTSCPAFGGADLTTLYCTSAADGLDPGPGDDDGKTFAADGHGPGQAEHRVIL